MTEPAPPARKALSPVAIVLISLLGGVLGAVLMGFGFIPMPHAATDKAVREYILTHPEVLPEAMENLQARENAKRLTDVRGPVATPWPGAIMGNPNGKVTLVEFVDFACGYCKRSVADVEQLIAANPDLKVVMRELPILSPESTQAAKMALAAAQQGKYAAFHKAMFDAGRPDAQTIAAAAQTAGLDMARAAKTIADPRVEAELERNLGLARQLGISGTPSWVAGNQLLSGAVGVEELTKALEDARKGDEVVKN